MMAIGLHLGGTTVDGFAHIKRKPMDQAAASLVDGFAGFVGDCGKSRSSRSEVEQPLMQQSANLVVGATNLVKVL